MRTPREKLIIKVTGVDGSRWTISGGAENGAGAEGIWLDKKHVGLITDSPVETLWESSANQIGATFRDVKYMPKEITLPVGILDGDDRSWMLTDSRWSKAWSFTADSTIHVIDPLAGTMRDIKARKHKSIEHIGMEEDSGHHRRMMVAGMFLKAGDPLWSSMTETDVWRFNGVNYRGSVTVSNPTDMPMYLQWTMSGPASFILPDHSFEDRPGWLGYEHRARQITMPFQSLGTDVAVDVSPGVEQVRALGKPNWWQLMNGQLFMYAVPPWTPPTELPVLVNPIPWLPELWHRMSIPFDIPTPALVAIADRLTALLEPLGTDTVLSWTPERLAEEIDAAIRWVLPNFVGDWIGRLLEILSIPTLGEVIAEAWGSVSNMAGSGVQVRMVRKWSRPYGLE